MKRIFLPLSLVLLLLAGCFSSGGRKAYLEGQLPHLVTQDLRKKAAMNSTLVVCQSVELVLDAPGHYAGKAVFEDGTQKKITVDDDGGENFRFKVAP
ncbi:hypothetical protein EON83_20960 [bacterium]|nr:MAG: hypothetical protein EON83_20960 [bacterium]